ncbi:hypothetical protein [Janthinobacterium sp. GMG1]|jgi:hypothetical protein|uniref:hypothetical protein n=1 Tax=Janthinobacterium sp. GMG1 TaxID=3096007 RepID=UPI002ACAB8F6|nr:hypothetical protein [Janthinobacterium sp. GMG1]MDZ5634452.1 hypothetical protein [Janthinobacterium sp. GMG1]
MSTYAVIVRTQTERFDYAAIAACCGDVILDAIDRYGVCGVSAKLKGAPQC